MEFDSRQVLREIQTAIADLESDVHRVRQFSASPQPVAADAEKLKQSVIVLKSETQLELGGPVKGSSKLVLCVDSPAMIRDGEISVIGPDIFESTESSVSLAQLIVASLSENDPSTVLKLAQYASPPGLLDGCMVRDNGDKIWYRISKTAYSQGISFQKIGSAVLGQLKRDIPAVNSACMIFAVSDPKLTDRFSVPVFSAHKAYKELKREIWQTRGVDITACSASHCGACKSHDLCDKVRDIEKDYRKEVKQNV